MPRTHRLLAVIILACPACAVEDDETSLRYMPGTTGNTGGGTVFNTNEMDNVHFSELTATDAASALQLGQAPTMAPGFTLKMLTLGNGVALKGFAVEAGEIVGIDAQHVEHMGAALLQSEWVIDPPGDGDLMSMRLKAIAASDDGVPRYRFDSSSDEVDVPTCPVGPDGPGVARLLTGFSLHEKFGDVRHAATTTYFACNTGATGKAADLGFYDLVADGADSDADWKPFEVAIRVIRADYCYGGNSFTTPGTRVEIEDKWDVMPKPPFGQKPGPIEAVWGAEGLLCRGQGRQQPIVCGVTPPLCVGKSLSDYPGALFLTRLPPKEPLAPSELPGDIIPLDPPSPL